MVIIIVREMVIVRVIVIVIVTVKVKITITIRLTLTDKKIYIQDRLDILVKLWNSHYIIFQ